MIDRDALHAALREFYTGKYNTGTSHVPTTCVRKAIEAYLAAAPLPTLCEDCPPIGYPTDKTRCEPCPRAAAPLPGAANLAAALRGMLQAVCGETGFANAVRVHSETAYPWEALDIAEKAAHDALAAAPLPTLCEDCPPIGYPTDKTRCEPCPRAAAPLPSSQSEIDDVKTKQRLTAIFLSPVVNDSFKIPFYAAAPDTAQAVASATEPLVRLIQIMLDNNPCDQISDAGHSVIDLWRQEAQAAIRARGAKP